MIDVDTFSEEMQTLRDIVGEDAFLRIIRTFSGEIIYFPSQSTLERIEKHSTIQKEFDGFNMRHLARKHKMSVRRIRQIVNKKRKRSPLKQAKLF